MKRKKPYRIAYVAMSFPPTGYAGAIRSQSLVDNLLKAGWHVEIYTNPISKNYGDYIIHPNFFSTASNKSRPIKRLLKEILFGLEIAFKLFGKKCDLIIIASPPFLSATICCMAARWKKTKYILDVKDLYPEIFFNQGVLKRESKAGRFARYLERLNYNNATAILAATQGLYDHIQEITDNKSLIRVRNGYDEKVFRVEDNRREKFTLITHGKLGYAQNVELLVHLVQQLEMDKIDCKVIIVGSGIKDYLIKELNSAIVEYKPFVPYHELPSLISQAHIGLSLRDDSNIGKTAFPVRIFEYMAMGLPILVTPISEAGLVVEKNKIGFQFDSENFVNLYSQLKELIASPEKLEILHKNALKCKDQFSRDGQVKFLTDFIQKNLINYDE